MKTLQVILLTLSFVSAFSQPVTSPRAEKSAGGTRFHPFDFNPTRFKKPALSFGPMTRWWWPGNDVTKEEIQREIRLFAANGFAGVEIQPFASGLNPKGPEEQVQRQFSWDTPSFYEHLQTAMVQAKNSGLIVDLNAGSGWPIGGPFITPDSSLLTLAYADTLVNGGGTITIPDPQLKQEKFTAPSNSAFSFAQTVSTSYAKLQAVILAKRIKKEAGQTYLDPASIQDITSKVTDKQLSLQLPEGSWQVLSFWSMPDGELPKGIASNTKGFVIDHLDSTKLKWSYNYLLGERTGLQPYFGNPLRAIFNDSYEFMADRHYAVNFLSFFRQQRGYDMATYLPVNMKKFYNNAYIAPFTAAQPFDFSLSDEDWRLRYDYDLTVSDLLRTQFIQPSNRWMNKRGLLHRTQAYGARMDVIGGSGEADIPEAEQLAGNNTEGFIKIVTSGAHLYNKPIITQESFVFRGFAETITPQKMKLAADKSFAAGVNQLIYHGTPYKYQTGEFGKEGWSPFSSPFSPNDNFSSTINESFSFWPDIKTINEYIARCQYLLQSGKPQADVLIYFPFTDFYPEQVTSNPTEILEKGRLKGVDPEITLPFPAPAHKDKTQEWFAALWPLVNRLEALGITWDFVNDAALQAANVQQGRISINGNRYKALVLANLPYVQLATAERISQLANTGARTLVFGEVPAKQPSYFDYKTNDEKTRQFIQAAMVQSNVKWAKTESELGGWVEQLPVELKFSKRHDFARTIEREMSDGSRVKFLWNPTDQWQTISFNVDENYKNLYWMNAETGLITKNKGATVINVLPPYGSVFLMAMKKALPNNILSSAPVDLRGQKEVLKLERWAIKIGDTALLENRLFDWRTNDSLKFKSGNGMYTTSFELKKESGKKYILDLGTVYFTAEIIVNGKQAGKRIWAPYLSDITQFLRTGSNEITVRVTPTYRNEFIGEAVRGNPKYAQFKRKEKTLMPAGLIGPVRILAVSKK